MQKLRQSGTIVGREYLAQFPKSAGRFVLDAITTRKQVGQGNYEYFTRVLMSDFPRKYSQ
jgi:hypothetical protein